MLTTIPAAPGYLMEVQAELKVVRRLNPVFISDKQFALFTHLIGTVPRARLGEPRANMARRHDDIAAALDMLFRDF